MLLSHKKKPFAPTLKPVLDPDDVLGGLRGRTKGPPPLPQTQTVSSDNPKGVEGVEDDLMGAALAGKRKVRRTFKESNLIGSMGVFKLYKEMQGLPLLRKPGSEAQDMAKVMGAYKTWASQLFPPLHSSVVLRKCRDWSGRGIVKNVLGMLREKEVIRAELGGSVGDTLSKELYLEVTEQVRAAAEAEANKRKEKSKRARGDATEGGADEDREEEGEEEGGGGNNEAEEEDEILDFTERGRRKDMSGGGREGKGEEEEEEEYYHHHHQRRQPDGEATASQQDGDLLGDYPGDDLDLMEEGLERQQRGPGSGEVILEDSEKEELERLPLVGAASQPYTRNTRVILDDSE